MGGVMLRVDARTSAFGGAADAIELACACDADLVLWTRSVAAAAMGDVDLCVDA